MTEVIRVRVRAGFSERIKAQARGKVKTAR